jgi:hypothetical protein
LGVDSSEGEGGDAGDGHTRIIGAFGAKIQP